MLDQLINKVYDDPIYIIVAIVILLVIACTYFRGYINNIMYNVIDNDPTIPNEKVVEDFTNKISSKLIDISNKVKKRKKLLILTANFITSKFVKNYLVRLLDKNPNQK